jgi:hypothetical protein
MAKRDWSDWLSPVLVKEIRQYFHSRVVHVLTWCLLGGQLLALLLARVTVSRHEQEAEKFNSELMYVLICVGMVGCGVLICGFMGQRRLAAERADSELDFTRITPLSPSRIVWGKMLGALVMACYLYALCLPFMVTAYFLRGLEMGDMLLAAGLMFPGIMLAAQLGLLFGASGKNWITWIYAAAMLHLGWSYLVIAGLMLFANRGGHGKGILLFLLLVLILLGLIFAICVAALNHPAANRMLPVRVYLLLLPLAGPLVGWGIQHSVHTAGWLPEMMFWATMAWLAVACAGCAILAAFERDYAGWRVTRNCPRNFVGRRLYFLFSSGWGGGILLSWLILLVLAVVLFCVERFWLSGQDLEMVWLIGFGIVLYFIATSQLTILLRLWTGKLKNWQWWLIIQGIGYVSFSILVQSREPIYFVRNLRSLVAFSEYASFLVPLLSGGLAVLGLLLLWRPLCKCFAAFHADARPGAMAGQAKAVKKRQPVLPEANVKANTNAKDGWNSWVLLCFRQLRHNRYLWLLGGVCVLFQALIAISRNTDTWESLDKITILLLAAGGCTIVCVTKTFSRKRLVRQEAPMMHFLDYSPLRPEHLLKGLVGSHALVFACFILILAGSLLCHIFTQPEDSVALLYRVLYIYLLSLNFMLLAAAGKIRLEILFCWIMLFLLFTRSEDLCPLNGSSFLVFVPLTLYLMAWFYGGREWWFQVGQMILLAVSWWMAHLYPSGNLLVLTPAMVAVFGAVSSLEEQLNSGVRRRMVKQGRSRKIFWWNWLWAWGAAALGYWILKGTPYEPWTGVIVIALFSGELAFLVTGWRLKGIRRLWGGDETKIYAALSIVFSVVMIVGFLLSALFEVDLNEALSACGRVGWLGAGVLLLLMVPALRARSRKSGGPA